MTDRKQVVIPDVPGAAPPDAKARWWTLGAYDDHGRSCLQARLVIGPSVATLVPQAVAQFVSTYPHLVVATGEPYHEVVYEISHGVVVLDRLGEFA